MNKFLQKSNEGPAEPENDNPKTLQVLYGIRAHENMVRMTYEPLDQVQDDMIAPANRYRRAPAH